MDEKYLKICFNQQSNSGRLLNEDKRGEKMAINQAIIRIRRGLKDELQIDKLLPGELAMATDAPCMWFCWSPGEVEQVPTSGNVIEHISQIVTEYIANNDISVIGKVFMRIYNGWIQYSPDEKTWKNVISLADIKGDEGGYYIPVINNNGIISWQPSQDGMEELQDSLILSKEIIESVLGYVPLKNTDVVDNLVSTATNLPLSAKQGSVIDEKISVLNTKMSTTLKRTTYDTQSTISTYAMTEGKAYIVHLNAVGSANAKYTAWLGIVYCNKADGTESGVQAWIENQKGGSYVKTNGKNIEMYCAWGYVATVIQIN